MAYSSHLSMAYCADITAIEQPQSSVTLFQNTLKHQCIACIFYCNAG
ncbi:hypothetical protein QWZ13_03100 [Reinekea marina]|nr:hypothetical protein [Reinekea marina]MDN3647898.1 hypothetical protein [Reinekea marina]